MRDVKGKPAGLSGRPEKPQQIVIINQKEVFEWPMSDIRWGMRVGMKGNHEP